MPTGREKPKTLEEIAALPKDWLVADDIAPYMHADGHYIRLVAKQRPHLLGFPVTIIGSRVKIPKIPFLRYCGWEGP